jgi:hypothetical protein
MSNNGPADIAYQMHLAKQRNGKITKDDWVRGDMYNNKMNDARKKPYKSPKIHTKNGSPSMQIAPAQTKEQNKIADQLLEWVKINEDIVNMSLFGTTFGYNFYDLENFVDTNPYFKECFNLAAQIIATRLDKRALDQKDSHTLHMRLWQYDPNFKKAWQEKLDAGNKKDEDKNTTFTIHTAPTSEKRMKNDE